MIISAAAMARILLNLRASIEQEGYTVSDFYETTEYVSRPDVTNPNHEENK